MFEKSVKILRLFICVVLIAQLMGCGTILYPERKGQKRGKIDAGVAMLDAMGVILFIIPGVIALAVDYYDGTIYLPGTSGARPLFRSTEQDVNLTVQNAGLIIKSAGRRAADSIRQALQ